MDRVRVDQKKGGVILSYLIQAVKLITGLVFTPIMLRVLGKNEYGLYQLVFSVVSYLELLNMGFGSSYMRFYSRAKVHDEQSKINELNGMFLCIFVLISTICLICGCIMIANIESLLGPKLSVSEYDTARLLMLFMILNLVISFLNSIFNCNLIAHEKFIVLKSLSLAQYILNPLLTLPFLLNGKGSISMVVVSTTLSFIHFIANVIFGLKVTKMQFSFRNFNYSLLKDMWIFTFYIFISQIINQINWNVDKFLLGRLIGTGAVAIYGLAGQINGLYLQFSTSISDVFIPRVNRIVADTDDNHELTVLFTKVGRIQFMVIMLILSGFIFIGSTFIELWAGPNYHETYYIALLLIIPVTIPLIQNLGIQIQRAKNMHKSRSLVNLIIAICNVLLSIPLIKKFGAIGGAVGTALALFFGNVLFMNWYYHYRMKLNMIYFWKNIIKLLPAVCISMLLGFVISSHFVIDSLIEIFLFAICYSLLYLIFMWFFGFNEYEKNIVYNAIRKIKMR